VARKKFHTEKWADAFLGATGKDAENVYYCLKALCQPIKSIHGAFFGYSASLQLEKILREVVGDNDSIAEYAIRFICLLVEKKCFKYVNSFLKRIEKKLDEQKGILAVTVETASPMDDGSEKELIKMIKEKIGAADVKMINLVRPELLSGYLLRIGPFFIDASLKGQLEKMRSGIFEAASQLTQHGGQ
jgi:ATP synthase F1 delta subunit